VIGKGSGNALVGKGENIMDKKVDVAFDGNTELAFRNKEGSKGRGKNLKDDGSSDAAIGSEPMPIGWSLERLVWSLCSVTN
jgi:hypothetical protein